MDNGSFNGLSEFVDEVHAAGMHYVVIIDPGISCTEQPGTYPPYDEGKLEDVFIKNSTGQELVGVVSYDQDTAIEIIRKGALNLLFNFLTLKTTQYIEILLVS